MCETIDSVINQTIGFEENIQIILVNNGSTDNSEKICKTYLKKHPNNIDYLYQQNKGVVEARNAGIRKIKKKYVNMLDSDDKWSLTAFEIAYNFFEEHYDAIDLLSCRVKLFERINNYHFLDYKFYEDRIADITEEYTIPQLFINSVFIKAREIRKCTAKTSISEDAIFATEIILKKGRYGILRSCEYLYRKSNRFDSVIDNRFKNYDYYIPFINVVCNGLFNQSIKKYGTIIPYFQYAVAHLCRKRATFVHSKPNVLIEEEWVEYKKILLELLNKIDDKFIFELKKVPISEKAALLALKYGSEFDRSELVKKIKVNIKTLQIKNGNLCISGESKSELLGDQYKFIIKCCNNTEYIPREKHESRFDYNDIDGTVIFEGRTFSAILPICKEYSFNFQSLNTGEIIVAGIRISKSILSVGDEKNIFNNKYTIRIGKKNIRIEKRPFILRLQKWVRNCSK